MSLLFQAVALQKPVFALDDPDWIFNLKTPPDLKSVELNNPRDYRHHWQAVALVAGL